MSKIKIEKVEPIQIGMDEGARRKELAAFQKKNNLRSEIDDFFILYDLELKDDTVWFVNDFKKLFDKSHGKAFPSFMPIHSKIELSGVPINKLQRLEIEYNAIGEVDIDRDYGIYAKTKRSQDALIVANQILELVKSYETFTGSAMPTLKYNEISQFFLRLTNVGERSINIDKIKNL